jgi:hypothetical protein
MPNKGKKMLNSRFFIVLVLVAILILFVSIVSSCAPPEGASYRGHEPDFQTMFGSVDRFYDSQFDNVCYVTGTGIACVSEESK